MTLTEEYLEGYETCKKEFEQYLHQSMKNNGGVVNGRQAFQVIDDVAMFLHVKNLQIRQAKEQLQSQAVTYVVANHLIH